MEPTRQSQTRFNVLDLKGRANRLEFAVFFIAWLIWLVARSFLDGPADVGIIIGLGMTVSVVMLLSAARRLHDLGRSGWWALLGFVPFLNLAIFVALSVLPGKREQNRFGHAPL